MASFVSVRGQNKSGQNVGLFPFCHLVIDVC